MKHKLLIAAAASALMAVPSLAQAQDNEGWYLRGNAGYGTHTDMDITPNGTSPGIGGDVESEGNIAATLGIGYQFDDNWRMELDGATMWTDLGNVGDQPSSFAKLRTSSLMLNALYDFDDFGRWAPYVGAGFGIIRGDADIVAHDFLDATGTNLLRTPACVPPTRVANQAITCDIDDDDTSFGWQLLAGLGYDITDNLTWDTHYRYQNAGDMDFNGRTINGVTGATGQADSKLEDIGLHAITTGFRYTFGEKAAPPPPPPPPMPVADFRCWDGSMVFNAGQCPAEPAPAQPEVSCWDGSMVFSADQCPVQPQTYTCWDGSIVYDEATCPLSERGNVVADLCAEQYKSEVIYYDFDKGASAETRNTINRILDTGQYCNVDNIRVVGHTDTSGSAAYNLGLSKRRAKDAVDELVRQGIDRQRISSEGKGETEPIIPGDNRKEQLNRRTEVLITLGSIGVFN